MKGRGEHSGMGWRGECDECNNICCPSPPCNPQLPPLPCGPPGLFPLPSPSETHTLTHSHHSPPTQQRVSPAAVLHPHRHDPQVQQQVGHLMLQLEHHGGPPPALALDELHLACNGGSGGKDRAMVGFRRDEEELRLQNSTCEGDAEFRFKRSEI